MEVGTRLNFSKCSLTVERDGLFINYELKPHRVLSGKVGFIEAIMMVIELLRDGLPIIHAHDRPLLGNQLQKFADYCVGSGFCSVFEAYYSFAVGKDFVEISRTIQALIVVDELLRGRYVNIGNELQNVPVRINGLIKENSDFSFPREKRFKAETTSAYFHRAFGEAIIPDGEYLEAKFAGKTITFEGGTALGFRPIRHFDSAPSRNTSGVDVFCQAVCSHNKDIAYLGQAEFEAQIDPACFPGINRPLAYGFIPLHWVTRKVNGPE